ncbi:MAG: ABC transporter ATP-binding protein [Gammaproteobacteria bacterium]|nr:ABC transporter ATP-binding protein [Gammaproteobacteria bacterium]
MSDSAIQIEGVHKRYGANQVLRGVDLSIGRGEFFGLVGVNGAGKTTLMKCLLDFARADAGALSLFGITHTEPRARAALAYLPEKFTPPYYLGGDDFLRYMAELYGISISPAALDSLLPIVDLDRVALQKPVRQLSKGTAQKLGILACLSSGRKLLVMDEPMSGLDPKVRARLKQHLLRLKAEGRTLFFSTHLLHDAETLCDRVAILHGGRVRFTGSPAQCCREFGTGDFEQAYLRCVG